MAPSNYSRALNDWLTAKATGDPVATGLAAGRFLAECDPERITRQTSRNWMIAVLATGAFWFLIGLWLGLNIDHFNDAAIALKGIATP